MKPMKDVEIFALVEGLCIGCSANGERRYLDAATMARELAAAARRQDREKVAPRVKRRKAA
ncbi:hypothetical protein IY145_17810 [Methylosinus sp. H3A]|uniref:hypothetical protein n=1 Tax=Methylosinus sp. H3A TaxID=2785786 RepID=UPI0018C3440B|nr:hypothetical protein [Methylosinus sp. H3A]MBG0811215.1 hypothetical protein [Methylosinus sp. H3A]